MKYDLVWFGTLVAVNLQTAFLSPPVAMSAIYLKAVVPEWELGTIYKGMMDFMVLQVIAIFILMVFPELATWFPWVLKSCFKNPSLPPFCKGRRAFPSAFDKGLQFFPL